MGQRLSCVLVYSGVGTARIIRLQAFNRVNRKYWLARIERQNARLCVCRWVVYHVTRQWWTVIICYPLFRFSSSRSALMNSNARTVAHCHCLYLQWNYAHGHIHSINHPFLINVIHCPYKFRFAGCAQLTDDSLERIIKIETTCYTWPTLLNFNPHILWAVPVGVCVYSVFLEKLSIAIRMFPVDLAQKKHTLLLHFGSIMPFL